MRVRSAAKAGLSLEKYEIRLAEQRALRTIRAATRHVARIARKERPRQTREQRNALARAAYRRDPTNWYAAAYRRRARLKSAAVVEEISRSVVFDRDGWRCRSCGAQVRDDVPRGHPRKAIMAHIVALAAGGDHSWANVCCLCHACNCRDGVNKLPLQMGLHFA